MARRYNLKIVCESRSKRCFSSSDDEEDERKKFRKASMHEIHNIYKLTHFYKPKQLQFLSVFHL